MAGVSSISLICLDSMWVASILTSPGLLGQLGGFRINDDLWVTITYKFFGYLFVKPVRRNFNFPKITYCVAYVRQKSLSRITLFMPILRFYLYRKLLNDLHKNFSEIEFWLKTMYSILTVRTTLTTLLNKKAPCHLYQKSRLRPSFQKKNRITTLNVLFLSDKRKINFISVKCIFHQLYYYEGLRNWHRWPSMFLLTQFYLL